MGYWSASHVVGALLIYAELFCRMALSICPDGLGSTLLQRPPNLPGCATGHALLRRLELIARRFTTRLAPIALLRGGGGVMRKLLLAAFLFAASSAFAQYPQRPIQLIVPWGAGGGTDATARIIGSLLERELKQPVNVVNRTGGSGVVGHQAIASSAPDGYTLGLITVEITMMHHVGLTQLRHTDYTPIGLVNADPAGVNVRADSPYKSMK